MNNKPVHDFSEQIKHLYNELELVKILREAGYDDSVLIYIWC
jgi:hypothetical protein